MPLLGKKAISQIRPLTDIKPDETIYTIAHTQEQFRSREYPLHLAIFASKMAAVLCQDN